MQFIKKFTRSFMAGFDHANPARHTNLTCSFDHTSDHMAAFQPVFDMVRHYRDAHQFEQIVALIEEYRQKPLYDGTGEPLFIEITRMLTVDIYGSSVEAAERALAGFYAWQQRQPDCPYATTGLAEALNQLGWVHRGGGYANSVTEAGWAKFLEYVGLSQEMMTYAQGRHTDHWYWNYVSLRNVTEANADAAEIFRRYDRAAHFMGPSPSVYAATVRPLLPRWGGDFELIERLADQAARETQHKLGDGAYAYVYVEALEAGEDIDDLHLNRDRFAKGCRDWLRARPSDYMATRFAGYAFMANDYALCQDLLEGLDIFFETAYPLETALTYVNSLCRSETER